MCDATMYATMYDKRYAYIELNAQYLLWLGLIFRRVNRIKRLPLDYISQQHYRRSSFFSVLGIQSSIGIDLGANLDIIKNTE